MGLEIKDLSFSYGDGPTLTSIGLSVPEGEFVGVIGPNGSGKTTLLKCASRVLDVPGETIFLDGDDICRLARDVLARKLAVVPQMTSVAFGFTVREVVLMGRTPHLGRLALETKRDMELAETNIARVGLTHLADRMVTEISGGELQRAIIACALTQEPKYLLLDEPTSHLDLSNQLEVLELVRELNEDEGVTVLSVFHDINLAARYCGRLVMMKGGRIAFDGTTRDVLTADNIREVFSVEAEIREHEAIGRPVVDVLGTVI